jgi:hypothetical protein
MPFEDKCSMRSLQNIRKGIIKSSSGPFDMVMALSIVEGLTGGSSGFKDFLDSGSSLPRTRYGVRNDGKRTYSGLIK